MKEVYFWDYPPHSSEQLRAYPASVVAEAGKNAGQDRPLPTLCVYDYDRGIRFVTTEIQEFQKAGVATESPDAKPAVPTNASALLAGLTPEQISQLKAALGS